MTLLKQKTTATLKESDLRPRWQLLDANGQILGRIAVQIAHLLKGKHKPTYSPHLLTGDFVIVINAKNVRVTGKKAQQKIYYRHSQYPGGLKEIPFSKMMSKNPSLIIKSAVKGMLPHNRLGRQMLRRLKIYSEGTHPHEAQIIDSLKAEEKDFHDGITWVGLPKIIGKKRKSKKSIASPVKNASSTKGEGLPAKEDISKVEETKQTVAKEKSKAPVTKAVTKSKKSKPVTKSQQPKKASPGTKTRKDPKSLTKKKP